jgi:hypothetical protein
MNARALLNRKLRRDKASILTSLEVRILERLTRIALGDFLGAQGPARGRGLSEIVRWGALQAKCEQAREKLGLDLCQAARRVGLPKYRLVAIEHGSLDLIRPDFARRYFEFLAIESFVRRWARANRGLARKAGLSTYLERGSAARSSTPKSVRTSPHRQSTRLAKPEK